VLQWRRGIHGRRIFKKEQHHADELSDDLMETVSQGARRFDNLLRRVRNGDGHAKRGKLEAHPVTSAHGAMRCSDRSPQDPGRVVVGRRWAARSIAKAR
jgi:hypothetical protein